MGPQELFTTSLFNDANLAHYYRLENVNDAKGAKNLTNLNSVAFNAAKFNNGGDLGSSNTNKALYYADHMDVNSKSNVTMSFWVKLQAEIAASTWSFLSYYYQTGDNGGFNIVYEYNSGTRRIEIDSSGSAPAYYPITLGTSSFYNFVTTSDGTTMRLYINGSSVVSQTIGASGVANNQINIGVANNQASAFASAIFDDVAIFSRVLTPTEISSLANGPSSLSGSFQFI